LRREVMQSGSAFAADGPDHAPAVLEIFLGHGVAEAA
jgi:hypothetical protein